MPAPCEGGRLSVASSLSRLLTSPRASRCIPLLLPLVHASRCTSRLPVRAARNFKLLDELEDAEKSAKGGADVSLGLQRPDDAMLRDWQASIFQSPVRLGDTLRGRASRGQRGRDAGAGDCASERLATNIY